MAHSDTACVDIFAILSRSYIVPLADLLPDPALANLAPDIQISYIGTQPANSLVTLTASLQMPLTHHFASAPTDLDIILVPGPDPAAEPSWDPAALAWLRTQFENGTDVLSICTGIFVCGAAGLLGAGRKRACGPRFLQDTLRRRYGAVEEWVGHSMRWTRDGHFWSSGGVTAGNDLVAAYCRQSGRFESDLVEVALAMAEVGDRPQMYADDTAAAA